MLNPCVRNVKGRRGIQCDEALRRLIRPDVESVGARLRFRDRAASYAQRLVADDEEKTHRRIRTDSDDKHHADQEDGARAIHVWSCRLTTQAQRRRPRGARIATTTARRRSLERMVSRRGSPTFGGGQTQSCKINPRLSI